jgi:hypothetical protein
MRRSQALQISAVNGKHEQQASAPCSIPAKRGKEYIANESAKKGQDTPIMDLPGCANTTKERQNMKTR